MTRTIDSVDTDGFVAAAVDQLLSGVDDTELELLNTLVDWEAFRLVLESIWPWTVAAGSRGRSSWAAVLMFKVFIYGKFQRHLSDAGLERDCRVNLATKQFVGWPFAQGPEAKTIHKYRSKLSASGRTEELFMVLADQLASKGYELDSGTMIDSSLVSSPVQRQLVKKSEVTKDEKVTMAAATDAGAAPAAERGPEEDASPEAEELSPPQEHQRDWEARWVKRPGKSVHGYKNHVVACTKHKLIVASCVTPANVHDSQVALGLLEKVPLPGPVYADRGYDSAAIRSGLQSLGHEPRIAARAPRQIQKTEEVMAPRKTANQKIARTRVRVEHIFATLKHNRGCRLHRGIGLTRAQSEIMLENVAYNRRRLVSLEAKLTR